jgi:hypothetical protein
MARQKSVLVVVVFLLTLPAVSFAQSTSSQSLAAQFAKRLGGTRPQSFAAAMPDSPSRFAAAMHIPGVQLLVITADYAAPALLRELILKGDHQRVYLDLNSAAARDGRFFVEDLGADGLRATRERDAAFDITWRNATARTLYNGDWKAQALSEAEYRDRFDQDAADYAEALQVLLAAHAAQISIAKAQPLGR